MHISPFYTRRSLGKALLMLALYPSLGISKPAQAKGRSMNTYTPQDLQLPHPLHPMATRPLAAIPVLVRTLLAMERIVNQQSHFEKEKPILGEMEYAYPKGPGGPLGCFFNSVEFKHFGGSFDRRTDTGSWYKAGLLVAQRRDMYPLNVTHAFYEKALGLVFEKNEKKDYRPQYDDESENKFYFHSKANPHIQYVFTAFLQGSSLKEKMPKNFFEVDVINTTLDK